MSHTMSAQELRGKVAIVTGASTGIGRQTAIDFALAGAKVVVVARSKNKLEELVQEINKSGGEATAYVGDVSTEAANKGAVALALKTYGRLDVSFINAGIFRGDKSITEVDDAQIDEVFNINCRGVIYGLKHQIPAMIATAEGKGSIITNSSVIGLYNSASVAKGAGIYAASKAWVNAITQVAAIENAGKVRVNAVQPGVVHTPIIGLSEAEFNGFAAGSNLVGRAGKPSEVSSLVTYLASDKASYITGSFFTVDGGFIVH